MGETAMDRVILLGAGMGTFFLLGIVQAVYGPALPIIARETGISLAEASVLFTAHWVGAAAGVAAMFLFGPRLTPRRLLLSLAVGAGLMGAGLGWPAMLAGATLAGFCQGCGAVLFNPRLLAVFGARGPAMLSFINALYGAGAILGPLALTAAGGAYGLVFLVLAMACALLWPGARDVGRVPAVRAGGPLRPDWVILALGAAGLGFEAALIGLGPAALVRSGESEIRAAELSSAFFVAYLLARVLLTFAAHRIAAHRLLLLSLAGVAATMAVALLWPDWGFVLSGAFAAMIFPGYFVEGMRRMGGDPRVSPLIVAGGLVGGIGLPFLLARLAEGMGAQGFFQMMAVLAGATLLAGGLAVLLRPPLRAGS